MNWIKCSERQPSKSGNYLVTVRYGIKYYGVEYQPFCISYDKQHWLTTKEIVAWNDEEIKPYEPPTGLQTVVVHIEGVEDDVEVFSKINTAITNAVEEEGYTVGALTSSWKEGGDK